MSRPRWSLPSQCSGPGRASVLAASVAMGSCVESGSAKIAVNTITSISTPPKAPSGFLRQKRTTVGTNPAWTGARPAPISSSPVSAATGLAKLHPGIEPAVEQVDEQVREYDHDRDEHDEVLDDRIIAPEDGLHEEARHTGQVEDGLGDDQAANQERELDADDGDDGEHGVLEGVAPDDVPLALALGPRCPHVVLAHDLEHGES